MLNNSVVACQARDKTKCRYHTSANQKLLQKAIDNEDYTAYAVAKKLIEEENKAEAKTGFVHDEKFRNVKKMPALFVIDREANIATTVINEKAAWIFDEPSKATIKRDGTSITVTDDGTIFSRRSVKKGKVAPPNFILAEVDSYTGHAFGLEPINQSGFIKPFKEALGNQKLTPGTYELCGPKINGNPEKLTTSKLFNHGSDEATEIPDMTKMDRAEAYETLKTIFTEYKKQGIEGVVWWGADGKRTKLRVYDFFGDPNRR